MSNRMGDHPQVKICGITTLEDVIECVHNGVNAIGFVFYPKSPRHVTDDQAKALCANIPAGITPVGVFVNETFDDIMKKVKPCGLKAVQLHGKESPDLVVRLKNEGLIVIKALFSDRAPSLGDAESYEASAFLVECGKGNLPGGNALTWNWKSVKGFSDHYPLILAGGLDPFNVCQAIREALPDAVDVSSGVESFPGKKDQIKISTFLANVSGCDVNRPFRKIWG